MIFLDARNLLVIGEPDSQWLKTNPAWSKRSQSDRLIGYCIKAGVATQDKSLKWEECLSAKTLKHDT
jgi:hypothetical protein